MSDGYAAFGVVLGLAIGVLLGGSAIYAYTENGRWQMENVPLKPGDSGVGMAWRIDTRTGLLELCMTNSAFTNFCSSWPPNSN